MRVAILCLDGDGGVEMGFCSRRKGDSRLGEHREADSIAVDGPQRPILVTYIASHIVQVAA